MHDAPSMAVKQKKKSSMRVCFDLVKAGEADAVVSAGNSGAMMACGMLVLGRLPGVERPAIVTTFPTRVGECALLDMGANVDPKPAVLAQFGVLGAVYARLLHGKTRPKVGLLSNGSEEHKGTPLTREAHQILARAESAGHADFSYLGYVEGRDIFKGEVDVVVTDGFTGNVVLKCVEGAAETMLGMVREEVSHSGVLAKIGAALMTGALRRLRKRTDYAEHGGAPLLGVDGVALICHGGSTATALTNAVYVADRFAQLGLGKELAAAVEFVPARPVREYRRDHVVQGGECRKQVVTLEHEPNRAPVGGERPAAQRGHLGAAAVDRAGVRALDRADQVQQRRLA